MTCPAIRVPRACGLPNDSAYNREPTQMGWYAMAAQRVANLSVLDVGCGTGAGLSVLRAGGAKLVEGQDVDPALEGEGIIISTIDALPAGYADVVTCIDVIEHVLDDLAFFNNLRRIARRELIVSTPNHAVSHAFNSCHAREYRIADFSRFFKPDVHLVGSADGRCYHAVRNDGSDDTEPHQCGIWRIR